MIALADVKAKLGVEQKALSEARDARARLEHRIALMRDGDPDLVEELAHKQLMIGGQDQVAMPRAGH
jgi:cell division protein FtsB